MNFGLSILMADLATKNGGLNHPLHAFIGNQLAKDIFFSTSVPFWRLSLALVPPPAMGSGTPILSPNMVMNNHGLLEDHRFSWMILQFTLW